MLHKFRFGALIAAEPRRIRKVRIEKPQQTVFAVLDWRLFGIQPNP